MPEAYLGDGVYATFDGHSVTLDLRCQPGGVEIVIEPEVYNALVKFWEACHRPRDPGTVMSSDGYHEGG